MSNAAKAFRSLIAELETLGNKETLTPEEAETFKSKRVQAEALKAQVENEFAVSALKDWANSPDGESVVKAGWSGEAIGQDENGIPEGVIEGVTSDAKGYLYDVSAVGARKLKALKSGVYKDAFREYMRVMARGQDPERAMKANAFKVLMEGIDTSGGFWVPPDLRPNVISKIATITGVKDDVYTFSTGSDTVSFPAVTYTTDNKSTTGIAISWTAEAPSSDISETTNPVAGRVNIPVHTALVAITVTRAMIEDAQFDILGFLSAKIGEAYALGMNDAFINGTGIGKPLGILSASNATVAHSFTTGAGGMYVPSGISGAVSWEGTAVGTPEPGEGLVGVESALPPQYEANAKWYMHKNTKAAVGGLVDTAGRPLWLRDNQYSNWVNGVRQPPMLWGYPVVVDQYVPVAAASSYSIIFGDLSGYYAPQRVGMSVEVLRELKALRDEVVVYARMRQGGQLVEDWRVKLMKLATS